MEISMENVSTQLYGEISMKKTLIAIAAQGRPASAKRPSTSEHGTGSPGEALPRFFDLV